MVGLLSDLFCAYAVSRFCMYSCRYNDFAKDWKIYYETHHELFSVYKVPKEHPYSRKKRRDVFLANLGLSAIFAMITVVMLLSGFGVDPNTRDEDIPQEAKYAKWVFTAFFAFIKGITGKLLKCMVLCPCCYTESCPNCCRDCWGCLGQILKCIYIVFLLFALVVTSLLAWEWDCFGNFLLSFVVTNMEHWGFSIIILRFKFGYKWKREKANKNNILSKYKVTYLQYEEYCRETMPGDQDPVVVATEQLDDKLLETPTAGAGSIAQGRVPSATITTTEMQTIGGSV